MLKLNDTEFEESEPPSAEDVEDSEAEGDEVETSRCCLLAL
jgi:hypothetical protein